LLFWADSRKTCLMKTLILSLVFAAAACAEGPATKATIQSSARVFIVAPGGFDIYLAAALKRKHIALNVTTDKTTADYEIQAVSEHREPLQWVHGSDSAGIQVVSLASGDVVFAYSVDRNNALHGRQMAAESVAVHLREAMGGPETVISKIRSAVSTKQSPVFGF